MKTILLSIITVIGLVSCGGSDVDLIEKPVLDSIPVADTVLPDTIIVDSSWHVFPPFNDVDSDLDTSQIIGRSLDSLHSNIAASMDLALAPDTNAQIVGKWMVHQKLNKDEVAVGRKEVFAVYHQDSIFSMKAINVLGKWWIEGDLLFQKYELPTKVNIDTSKISVLNDSVLQVSEFQGDALYIFKKVK